MSGKVSSLLLSLIFLVTLAGLVFAEVPAATNYQGLLTDALGDPVADGSYSVTFTIYDAAIGGSSKWSEIHSVSTTGGRFAAILGSLNPLSDTVFEASTRYLGIKVGSDPELTPRTMLITVPYAFRAATVDGASGGNIISKVAIGTGHDNSGEDAFVAGENNNATGDWSAVGGGLTNHATGETATIGGGQLNTCSGSNGTISGGSSNNAGNSNCTISGGASNVATGVAATVGGGIGNKAEGDAATIAGGYINRAAGEKAVVGGGFNNEAPGTFSTVPGGAQNLASGYTAFAGGRQAEAIHAGTFVWADSSATAFTSTDINQFLIRAENGVGINTNAPSEALEVSGNICCTGTIGACSDMRYKKDIETIVDPLAKLLRLRGVTYNWKIAEYPEKRFAKSTQLGFVAQELEQQCPELVMTDDHGYKSVDYGRLTPVLVEAIKEQQNQIGELQQQLDDLKALVANLAARSRESNPVYGGN